MEGKTSGTGGCPAGAAAWFCAYTPLEMIDAAGFEPRRVLGDIERLEEADALLHPAVCPYVRACLVEGLGGKAGYTAFFVNSCDAMRRLHDAWKSRVGGRVFVTDMPRAEGERAERSLAAGLLSLAEELRDAGAGEVTADKLREAAETRREVARRFAEWGEGLAGTSRMRLAEAAHTLPPRRFLEGPPPGLTAGSGVPLLLTGNLLNPEGLVAAIEEAGGWVKVVDLCNGDRPFGDLRAVEGETLEELCLSLARRYLERRGCARMQDAARRDLRLREMLEESGAKGVIYASLKFCDAYLYDYPRVEAFLQGEGIPVLRLESDYLDGHAGQLSTRVEAFLEMLREREAAG